MKQYHEMLIRIRDEGVKVEDRTGTGTTSVFGHQARFNLQEGFPMVTTKRVPFKALTAELEWFLQGNTNNNRLNGLGTTIWDEWANEDGNLGPIYGAMWRRWPVGHYETHLVDDKSNLGDNTKLPKITDGQSMTQTSIDQWATDKERTLYKSESELFIELLSRGIVCVRWYHLKTFAEDLASIPGYELWKAHPTKYVLSIKYFNAEIFRPDTCIFVPVEYEASLKHELTPVTITKESGAKSTISTLDDLEEFVGVSHRMMYVVQSERVLVNKESIIVDLSLFNGQQTEEIVIAPFEVPEGKLVRRKLYVDQIANLLETLKNNPTSRRMIVSGWNPTLLPDTTESFESNINNGKQALPPCHTLFQYNTRPLNDKERMMYGDEPKYVLSCQLYMRSNDVPLGAGFNIASYALLTELIAREVGMIAGELIYTVGDLHVYNNQLDIYQVLEREPYPLPKLNIKDSFKSIFDFKVDDVELIDYVSHGPIKLPVSI